MNAVVTTPICPLRAKPHPAATQTDEVLFGMTVTVLCRTTPAYWHVRTAYRYEGYAPARCLCPSASPPRGECRTVLHRHTADVLAAPSLQAACRLTLPLGAQVTLAGPARDGWQPITLPSGATGYLRASALAAIPQPDPTRLRQRLVDTALRYRGSQYRWGGKTPLGVDCSGLVFMTYHLNGLTVYRDARLQPGFALVQVPLAAMEPGDALYFPGHVALYLGDSRYLHATARPGDDGVTCNSLDPAHPDYRADLAHAITCVGSYIGFHR